MHTEDLLPLVVIAMVAFMAPLVSLRIRYIKVPAIILEIVLGILLGRSGLGLLGPTPVIDFLSEFGFIFLMFLSGFEIDVSLLRTGRSSRWRAIGLPVVIFALTLAGSLVCATGFRTLGLIDDVILFALVLSTTSVGIVMPTLKERAEIGTSYGQTLVLAALVADLSTILLLTFTVIYLTRGYTAEGLLVSVVFLAFVVAYAASRSLRRVALLGKVLEELAHASTQIKVRGSLAILVLFVVLAKAVGVEAILSAFLAGLLVSFVAKRSRIVLGAKLDAVGYGFFVPFFFIMVGAKLELADLLTDLDAFVLVPLLIVIAFIVKVVPALLFRLRFGWRDSLAGGALLSSRLALIVAASQIALSIGAITHAVNAAVILTAVVTCIVSPAAYIALRGSPSARKPRAFIVGGGRIGRELVKRLAAHDVETVVIERCSSRGETLEAEDVQVVIGDGTRESTLNEAGITTSDVLVALTDDDEANFRSCQIARDACGVGRAVARDNDPENTIRFEREGIVPLELSSTLAIAAESLVLRPTLMALMSDAAGDVFAFEVQVCEQTLVGRRVEDLLELGEALLVVIRRGSSTIIPHGETRLEAGDSIVLVGTAADEARVREVFSARHEARTA